MSRPNQCQAQNKEGRRCGRLAVRHGQHCAAHLDVQRTTETKTRIKAAGYAAMIKELANLDTVEEVTEWIRTYVPARRITERGYEEEWGLK